MPTIDPTEANRRSFVYRKLLAAGATFETLGDGTVATNFPEVHADAMKCLAICDLSGLPRVGIKGRDTIDWLRSLGFGCDDIPNQTHYQANGTVLAVLSPNEAALLSPLTAPNLTLMDLVDKCSLDNETRCYPVPRADMNFEFLVSGQHAAEMFSKVCGINLRPSTFPANCLAQTSVASVHAIVLRADVGKNLAYRILGDSTSAEYIWDCLTDAMSEYGGTAVGFSDVRSD